MKKTKFDDIHWRKISIKSVIFPGMCLTFDGLDSFVLLHELHILDVFFFQRTEEKGEMGLEHIT